MLSAPGTAPWFVSVVIWWVFIRTDKGGKSRHTIINLIVEICKISCMRWLAKRVNVTREVSKNRARGR